MRQCCGSRGKWGRRESGVERKRRDAKKPRQQCLKQAQWASASCAAGTAWRERRRCRIARGGRSREREQKGRDKRERGSLRGNVLSKTALVGLASPLHPGVQSARVLELKRRRWRGDDGERRWRETMERDEGERERESLREKQTSEKEERVTFSSLLTQCPSLLDSAWLTGR